jgi:hypothetical protein
MLTILIACATDRPEPAGGVQDPDPRGVPIVSPSGADPISGSTAASNGVSTPASTAPVEEGKPIELCINEFMADTVVSSGDEDGLASDWIELHNPTDEDVPLAGWSIADDPAEPTPLGDDLVLEAHGFLVLWADSAPERGSTHLDFALSDGGEAVALFDPLGNGSIVWFGPVGNDIALARVTDCCTEELCFEYRFAGSPGSSNGAAPEDSGT